MLGLPDLQERTVVPIEWESGWAAGQSECFGEDKDPLPIPGFKPQTIQSVT